MVRDNSLSSKILSLVVHCTVVILLIVTLYPVLHVASVSFSRGSAVMKNEVTFYPKGFNLNAYDRIFSTPKIPRGYMNSLLYTSVGTAINLLLTACMAYALSKKRLTFRSFYTTLVIVTMFFGGGLIPTFLLVKSLGMYNTLWALVIPTAISTWNLIIMRTFFMGIPTELEESAFLDGANDITVLVRIVLPLSKAAIATIGLFYMVGHWNSWFPAVIYLKDSEKYPLQVYLRQIVIQNILDEELGATFQAQMLETIGSDIDDYITVEKIKYATLFASLLPMLIVYPLLQKYFVKGIMIGSLKG